MKRDNYKPQYDWRDLNMPVYCDDARCYVTPEEKQRHHIDCLNADVFNLLPTWRRDKSYNWRKRK